MADDPTTTGHEQPPTAHDEKPESVRLPVGLLRERHPFKVEVSGEVVYEVDLRAGVVRINVKAGDWQEWIATIPLALFTGESLVHFLSQLKQDFLTHLGGALLGETYAHLGDVIGFLLKDMDMDTTARDDIIEQHLTRTRNRLAHLLGDLPDKTTGTWTKIKLEGAIRVAMYRLAMRGHGIKAETVAAELRGMDAATGPASGGALKKQVSRFSINWRRLRREIEEIAAAQREGDIGGGANVTKKGEP